MSQRITNQIKELIPHLKEVNSKLQGESIKLFSDKESIIVERRKPVVEEMLKHLESSSITNCNTMIDAETGFGKTYDIGLWSHALAQAGYHHLVAVPNGNLVEQAKKMIDGAFTVDVKTPKTVQEIKDALKVTEPTTIIVTHDLLLQQENDRKFEEQNGEKPKLWVSVDEADSINKQQAFENMCKLDAEYPTTYLTATPKKRILNRCGKIISPTRSSRRCIADTIKTVNVIAKTNEREKFNRAFVVNVAATIIPLITLFPIINSNVAAIIGLTSDYWLYSALINNLYFTISFVILSIVMLPIWWVLTKITGVESKELLLRFAANVRSLFTREKSSPAHEYVEECEEVFNYNKLVDSDNLLESVRWNVQSPIGENALILVDDVNSIINLSFALQGKNNLVYEDGTRYEVYNKFQPEGMSYQDYRLKLRQSNFINCVKKQHPGLTEEQISKLKDKVDFSNTAKYLEYRVMHSMIDLTLSYLVECDNTALDKQRRKDLGGLIEEVKNKVSTANDSSITDFLKKKGFSEKFAKDELLPQIKTVIKALSKSNDKQRSLIVDNWHLSKELHSFIEQQGDVLHNLNDFCEKNKCIFAGFGKNDLDIRQDKPFFKIMHDSKSQYEADYCNYDQGDLNTLAKYALTTIIDESKSRGFDSEYNHVASIFTDSTSQFNNPAEALQNLGRNRERNPNRQPWFFAAGGEKIELFVDKVLAKLKSAPQDFCQKVLFPATDRYNKLIKNRMGIELGEKIEIYISENMDALGNIDDAALKKFSKDLIKEVYEKVHDINDFDVGKTEEDLRKILKSTEKYLCSYEDRIKNNGKLSCTRSVLFSVGSAIVKSMYYLWAGFDYLVFLAKAYNVGKSENADAKAYVHIIRNCYFESSVKAQNMLSHVLKIAGENDDSFTQNSLYEGNGDRCKEKIISYFQSKQYIYALDKTISRIENEHLATVLKAVGCRDDANKTAQEIKDFLYDLKNLSCADFRKKHYCGCSYKMSNLYKINNQISMVIDEVIDCHKWRHGVISKRDNLLRGFFPELEENFGLELKLKTNHNIFKVKVNNNFSELYRKNWKEHSRQRMVLGTAMLFIGLIVSAKLIYEISLGHTMLLPSLCGFIAFGPLAFLCGALLCGITTYLVKGTFFLFGIPILLEGLSKCVFRNDLVQDLSETTLSFGNSVFFQVPKSILQSFIFEDATKFDSLSDINGLTLIKEQDKVKCMNEVATTIISVQTTVGKQPDLTCVFA
ncbi:DEAD/DEAH box helicase family protein [Wolbachia endosymbiont (group A) of Sympetrum striolatum]|uniref:DEAD/DEAH box helicase family protein n=1 Tax=Wolbachia endosymbiont (group A) of Sympetrum striolatum TaxID=2954061 RepID=UPI002226D50D|nr:DEAD/DEAH box helicase family protein [Wolbachia endosymbiont (group A) of Sympetrum striolatum]